MRYRSSVIVWGLLASFAQGQSISNLQSRMDEIHQQSLEVPKIDPKALKRAQETQERIESPDFKKKVRRYQEVFKDHVASQGFEVEREESIESEAKKRAYLFISSSMPSSLLKSYFEQADAASFDVVFVLRGFIDGATKMKPTLQWIKKHTKKDCNQPPCHKLDVNIIIDPRLFEKYAVDSVPAMVLQGDPPSKVSGTASLGYMIQKMTE